MREEMASWEALVKDSFVRNRVERDAIRSIMGESLSAAESQVGVFSRKLSGDFLEHTKNLMQEDAWKSLAFSKKMGLARWKLMDPTRDAFKEVSSLQREILLRRNRQEGAIVSPKLAVFSELRLNQLLDAVGGRLSTDDFESAAKVYAEGSDQIVKESQMETVLKLVEESNLTLEGKREIHGDTCDWCVSVSGFWTTNLRKVSYFHGYCSCTLVTQLV